MTEVRKNSTETTIFSKCSARKMSKVGVSAKADTPKRRFRSQKLCDAEIEVSVEAQVPLLRKLQIFSQCDRALRGTHYAILRSRGIAHVLKNNAVINVISPGRP